MMTIDETVVINCINEDSDFPNYYKLCKVDEYFGDLSVVDLKFNWNEIGSNTNLDLNDTKKFFLPSIDTYQDSKYPIWNLVDIGKLNKKGFNYQSMRKNEWDEVDIKNEELNTIQN